MKLGAYTACLHDRPLEEMLPGPQGPRPDLRRDQRRRVHRHPAHPDRGAPGRRAGPRGVPRDLRDVRHRAHRAELQRQPAAPRPRGAPRRGPQALHQAGRPARHQDGDHDVGAARDRGGRHPPVVDGDPLGQRLQGDPGLPVERGRGAVLEGDPGPGRRERRARRDRDAPAQPGLQPGHHEAAGRADDPRGRGQPRRRRDGPQPPVLAAHRPDPARSRTSATWCSSPPPRTR